MEGQYIAQAAKYIGAGLCALSMIGAALGVASIWVSVITTVGRNPSVKRDVSTFDWAGFPVTEAVALYALVVALIMLFL